MNSPPRLQQVLLEDEIRADDAPWYGRSPMKACISIPYHRKSIYIAPPPPSITPLPPPLLPQLIHLGHPQLKLLILALLIRMSLALFTTHTHLSSLLPPHHPPPPKKFLQKQKTPLLQSASKKGIPHTSTAGRILQSGTGSAGSGGWRTSRGRRGGGGRRTFLLAWRGGRWWWCLVGTGGSGVSFRYGGIGMIAGWGGEGRGVVGAYYHASRRRRGRVRWFLWPSWRR
jgi:hypothetical protein